MKRIEKTSMANLAARALKEEVLRGVWTDRLPGGRELSKRLGVSQPTVASALRLLVSEGVLERRGERKAYQVVKDRLIKACSTGNKNKHKVLVLTHDDISRIADTSRLILENLQRDLLGKGWDVRFQILDFLHAKKPQRTWDVLIELEPDLLVVALYGRPALAEWALKRKVKILFLGGATDRFPVPMLGVRSAGMAKKAVTELIGLGHSRIILPLCDRPESYKKSIRDAMKEAFLESGTSYLGTYHHPESEYLKADVSWRIMESAFKSMPPTALIFLDWKELVSAFCFLAHSGYRVPEDVSLVLLNDQAEAEWFLPSLARFRFPVKKIVKNMIHWLESRGESFDKPWLEGDFIMGETLAPPRRE